MTTALARPAPFGLWKVEQVADRSKVVARHVGTKPTAVDFLALVTRRFGTGTFRLVAPHGHVVRVVTV